MLALWLDLREAMLAADAAQRGQARLLSQPWQHESATERAVWNQITDPQNECALAEWLSVVGTQEDERWAHQAFLECQRRKAKRWPDYHASDSAPAIDLR